MCALPQKALESSISYGRACVPNAPAPVGKDQTSSKRKRNRFAQDQNKISHTRTLTRPNGMVDRTVALRLHRRARWRAGADHRMKVRAQSRTLVRLPAVHMTRWRTGATHCWLTSSCCFARQPRRRAPKAKANPTNHRISPMPAILSRPATLGRVPCGAHSCGG